MEPVYKSALIGAILYVNGALLQINRPLMKCISALLNNKNALLFCN